MSEPEIDYDAEMRLPDGRICSDCVHASRCVSLGFASPTSVFCDFWPSKFREAALVPQPLNEEPR